MLLKKKKTADAPFDPYSRHSWPNYCVVCGEKLIKGSTIPTYFFDSSTGVRKAHRRYSKYCPDWQINSSHTVMWGDRLETEDALLVLANDKADKAEMGQGA